MAGLRHATEKLQELEDVFAALAHGSRRQILLTIWFVGGRVSSSDIAARFHHAWPTISRHIKILIDAKLLVLEKQGRHRYYRVNQDKIDVVRQWLQWFGPTAPLPPVPPTSNE